MKTTLIRATAGAAVLAAGVAGAQTVYSAYPTAAYPTSGYAASPASVVRCESINSDRNFCRADTRGGVEIVRQISREDCIRGRNWEVRSDGIVVDDGCRADFAVASGYASQGDYTTDRYGRRVYRPPVTYTGTYDAYGRPVYDGGYTRDRYGNIVYVDPYGRTSGNYTTDRYGNRIYVAPTDPYARGYGNGGYSNGGYAYDRNGNRVYVGSGTYNNGYAYDQYGGYYVTDTYGRRVYVGPNGYSSDAN